MGLFNNPAIYGGGVIQHAATVINDGVIIYHVEKHFGGLFNNSAIYGGGEQYHLLLLRTLVLWRRIPMFVPLHEIRTLDRTTPDGFKRRWLHTCHPMDRYRGSRLIRSSDDSFHGIDDRVQGRDHKKNVWILGSHPYRGSAFDPII